MRWLPVQQVPHFKTTWPPTSPTSSWWPLWFHCDGLCWPLTKGWRFRHDPDHHGWPWLRHTTDTNRLDANGRAACRIVLHTLVLQKQPTTQYNLRQRQAFPRPFLEALTQTHRCKTKNVLSPPPRNRWSKWMHQQNTHPMHPIHSRTWPVGVGKGLAKNPVWLDEHDKCSHRF